LIFLLAVLRRGCGRAGIGVGVQDRPAGPTAKRPQVLDVDAARRTLFEAEKKLSGAPLGRE